MTTFKARKMEIDRRKPFPRTNWKSGEWTVFNIDVDGDNIVVDGYSMPVKEDREFAFQCKKTFIKARGGAEGLYKFLDKEKNGCMVALVGNIVNWIVTFGKRKEVTA